MCSARTDGCARRASLDASRRRRGRVSRARRRRARRLRRRRHAWPARSRRWCACTAGSALPRILPLRAGTMNTVARAMGCPAWQPERMLAEIVDDLRRGRRSTLTEHQLICVNGGDYGFMVGAGVPVEFLRVYYDQPRRGAVGAARTLVAADRLGPASAAPLVAAGVRADAGAAACDGVRGAVRRYTRHLRQHDRGHRPRLPADLSRARAAGPLPRLRRRRSARCDFIAALPAIQRGAADALARRSTTRWPAIVRVEFRAADLLHDRRRHHGARPTQLDVAPGPVVRVIRR